jgi:YspA, cpYpsA-related SLOG family
VRILVCGSRNWKSFNAIFREVISHPDIECIIEGECKGADLIGRMVGEFLGVPILRFPADWKAHGSAAGPIRNVKMLKEGNPDIVLAFHEDIEGSKGTKNMVKIAKDAGVMVEVFSR